MIRKRQPEKGGKKVHPIIGALLFGISILLLLITGPVGFLYGLIFTLVKSGFKGVSEFLLKIAVSIDQLGNVIMQHLLNAIWIKKGGYRFGNRDETISSALGRNKRLGTLTVFGKLIDKLLDIIDPNHSLDSIDYYIEPSDDITEELAWIHTQDRKLLCLRNAGAVYRIPSVKKSNTDSDGETLFKMVQESLGIELDITGLSKVEVFQTASGSSGHFIRKLCYRTNFPSALGLTSHIPEISWLGYADRDSVSEIDQMIFDYLYQKGDLG